MSVQHLDQNLDKVCKALKSRLSSAQPFPSVALILGSGFRAVLNHVKTKQSFALSEIDGVPLPKVAGHGADFIVASLGGKNVVILSGRIHLYEGHSAHDVCFMVRVLARLGCKNIILTNAAGGLNRSLRPGQIVLLKDHLNLTGTSPLLSLPASWGSPFVDMNNAYDKEWRAKLKKETKLKEGVYAGLLGPAYETPAEVNYLGRTGATLVGMSTVLETIAARQQKMRVLGLSLVTNLAGGLGGHPLSHKEVLETAKASEEKTIAILERAVAVI